MSKPHANPAENEFGPRLSARHDQQTDNHSTENQQEEGESENFRPVAGASALPQIRIGPIIPRQLLSGDGPMVMTQTSVKTVWLIEWVIVFHGFGASGNDAPKKR